MLNQNFFKNVTLRLFKKLVCHNKLKILLIVIFALNKISQKDNKN